MQGGYPSCLPVATDTFLNDITSIRSLIMCLFILYFLYNSSAKQDIEGIWKHFKKVLRAGLVKGILAELCHTLPAQLNANCKIYGSNACCEFIPLVPNFSLAGQGFN